jgi:Tfp pilus assembly protein PilF
MGMTTRLIAIAALAAVLAAAHGPAASQSLGVGGNPDLPTAKQDPDTLYADALRFFNAGDLRKAERTLREALDLRRSDASFNLLMGVVQLSQGDDKDARRFLRAAVKADGDLVDARVKLGVAAARLGDEAELADQRAWLEARKTACAGACGEAGQLDAGLAEIAAAVPETDD